MFKKLLSILLILILSISTVACGSSTTSLIDSKPSLTISTRPNVSSGEYPVQQATYNDVDGQYSLMLLNTPPGSSPVFATKDLQMARLSDEQIKTGKKSYLQVTSSNSGIFYLTEDFKIQYIHNVTQNQTNPETGRTERVVVRTESSFWSPFMGALAGQAVANLLFTPTYYLPPVYSPGVVMTGYGGYGSSYNQAVSNYQTRYQTPPPSVINRQTVRTSGNLRSPNSTINKTTTTNRSTGSGIGSSTLKSNNRSSSVKRSPGFGSGTRSRSFSRGRR